MSTGRKRWEISENALEKLPEQVYGLTEEGGSNLFILTREPLPSNLSERSARAAVGVNRVPVCVREV